MFNVATNTFELNYIDSVFMNPEFNPEAEVSREADFFRTMRSAAPSGGVPVRARERVVERRFLQLRADPDDDAAAQVLHAEESRRSVRELWPRYDEASVCARKRKGIMMKIRVVIMNDTCRRYDRDITARGALMFTAQKCALSLYRHL